MLTLFFGILAYFIGSLSTAILISRLFGLPDPRQVGSGNPGATNVLRQGKKWAAAVVLIGDVFKGWLPVALAIHWGGLSSEGAWVGLAALLGHLFPVYFQFKGGKGVATGFGVILALAWPVGLLTALVWLITASIFRYSSLAAIIATLATPFLFAGLGYPLVPIALPLGAMLALIIWRHRANIQRLLNHQETKLTLRSTKHAEKEK